MKKYVNIALSLTAAIYTCWYMHFGIPYKNSGALSTIGLEHKGLFVLWGILTFTALAYSLQSIPKIHNKRTPQLHIEITMQI